MPNAPYTSSTNPTGAAPTKFGKITAQIVQALLGDVFEFLSGLLRVKKPLTISGELTVSPILGSSGTVIMNIEGLAVTDGFDYPYHNLKSSGDMFLSDGAVSYDTSGGVTTARQLSLGTSNTELVLNSYGSTNEPGHVLTRGEDGEAVWKALPSGSAGGMVGSVNPEGVVIANPGVTYFNVVLSTFWVKKEGSNVATGWLQLI